MSESGWRMLFRIIVDWLRQVLCTSCDELAALRQQLAEAGHQLRIADIIPYWATIKREAEARGFDPFMAAGLVDAESAFCRNAIGDGGLSRGLMQLSQGAWIDVTGDRSTWHQAFVPSVAIPVGLDYLRQCQTLCAGLGQLGIEWALGTYNWGKGNMLNHIKAGKSWQELPEQVRTHVGRYLAAAERLKEEVAGAQ